MVATSGKEALKALLVHKDFAVIIMDVQMPEMDGYETAGHIKRRSRTRETPIIFLTAIGTNAEHRARGYAIGAVDYIAKPFDPWALRAKVSVFTDLFLERRTRQDQGITRVCRDIRTAWRSRGRQPLVPTADRRGVHTGTWSRSTSTCRSLPQRTASPSA